MKESKIEWTDHTHNEWIGCEKISDGCKHCYAEELMDKRYARAKWGANGTRTLTSTQNRNKPFSWNRKAEKEGVRYKVFAQSLSDTFEDREELEPWRIKLFEKIASTPNLDWLLLTKRPDVAKKFFQKYPQFKDLSNLWLGVSVENQKTADERIPILLDIPAKVRFLSMEPLLEKTFIFPFSIQSECCGFSSGYVSIAKPMKCHKCKEERKVLSKIDWVIVGGESGRNARPMHPDWVRIIQEDCEYNGIPFFFKQWGEWLPGAKAPLDYIKGQAQFQPGKYHDFGDGFIALKLGKKEAGSLLDGLEWKEFPVS